MIGGVIGLNDLIGQRDIRADEKVDVGVGNLCHRDRGGHGRDGRMEEGISQVVMTISTLSVFLGDILYMR